jgi:NTE family protein
MFRNLRFNLILFALLIIRLLPAQNEKVGVVLSGGGASGLAHIGVLKALEEDSIPIDYICGTSMGALVGCLYSMGYTPTEIEAIIKTEDFRNWATGTTKPDDIFYFKRKDDNASWITFKLSLDTTLSTNLPTNVISPVQIDFGLMQMTAGASAAAGGNFDSLFIPFRCVASDIASKQSVIFRNGDLGESVRASMSYPFYLKPIRVNGKLLFDGGLYNNFPANVMYEDFFPDFIVGSNVATAFPNPDEDNLVSQIRAMLTSRTDFDPKCENGVIIAPNADWVGLFEFDDPSRVIDSGYVAAKRKMSEIKLQLKRRSDASDLAKRRSMFKAKQPHIVFDKIEVEGNGLKKNQRIYVNRLLRRPGEYISIESLKPGYMRLAADDKIMQIFPKATYNKTSGYYDLKLTIKKERKLFTHFGGNFSNRPINMGFVGLQYNFLGNPSTSLIANAYFGKLYSSASVRARIDFPTQLLFYLEPGFTWNRLDYFRSSPAFFEDTKPPYLIHLDRMSEINAGIPVRNKGRLVVGVSLSFNRDLYYQNEDFTSADTVDRTDFTVGSTRLFYERNTLNRKQYASQGTYFAVRARFIRGEEFYDPGTTAIDPTPLREIHEWVQFRITYDTYFKERGRWRLGFLGEAVYSSQPFFSNYTATMLSAPEFQPTPESRTYFLPQFRAHQFAAAGLKSIFLLRKTVDLRFEGYAFMPYQAIINQADNTAAYAAPLSITNLNFIAVGALIWHSPLGPVSLSVNHYSNNQPQPFSLLFHFGYIIFNRKALD